MAASKECLVGKKDSSIACGATDVKGSAVAVTVGLLLILAACAPATPPETPVPQGQLIFRPTFDSKQDIPEELRDMYAPAILLDPTDPRTESLLELAREECRAPSLEDLIGKPCEFSPEDREAFAETFTWVIERSDAYVWFQPPGSPGLVPGPWGELMWPSENRELFLKWFMDQNATILVEPTAQ